MPKVLHSRVHRWSHQCSRRRWAAWTGIPQPERRSAKQQLV